MTDKDVRRILADGFPIAAVLLNRGGWLSGSSLAIYCRFEEAETDTALWQIDVCTQDDAVWHSIYIKAESVVGISCRRSPANADQERDRPSAQGAGQPEQDP